MNAAYSPWGPMSTSDCFFKSLKSRRKDSSTQNSTLDELDLILEIIEFLLHFIELLSSMISQLNDSFRFIIVLGHCIVMLMFLVIQWLRQRWRSTEDLMREILLSPQMNHRPSWCWTSDKNWRFDRKQYCWTQQNWRNQHRESTRGRTIILDHFALPHLRELLPQWTHSRCSYRVRCAVVIPRWRF